MAEDGGFAMGYALGQDSGGGGNNGGGFGGSFGEGLWAVIILAILFGRGGFGNNDSGGGGSSGGVFGGGFMAAPWATQADLAAGFNNSAVLSGINDLRLGQASVQQTLCQGFNGINTSLLQGFHGVDNAICTLGYQQKDCCCETQRLIERGFCDLGQSISMQTRDIIDNQNANYRGLMDFMVQSKIDKLRDENDALRLRASQADQNAVIRAAIDASTAEIIRRTGNDYPSAAFLVQPPTPVSFPTNCCGQVQFGYGKDGYGYGRDGGCGCGC